ncbi:MAG: hypothetical protein LBU42_10595 [Prevotellaceae bacterium]|jgi:hypothetical protein|nr:hypothetical protein [Prevotellaceae bacterium]
MIISFIPDGLKSRIFITAGRDLRLRNTRQTRSLKGWTYLMENGEWRIENGEWAGASEDILNSPLKKSCLSGSG